VKAQFNKKAQSLWGGMIMTELFGVFVAALRATALRMLRGLMAAALLLPGLALAQTSSVTALSVSPNPSNYGQSITLTASVTGDNPSGSVSFLDGGTTLGSSTLNAGVATFSTNALSAATHSLTAVYAGDANNTVSTSTALDQVVNAATTTSTVASSLNPSTSNATVTFTATVNGQSPTGTVTFNDGANVLGTASLSGTGNSRTATYAVSALSVASHSITAVYAGDGNNSGSTSAALNQVVNAATTTSSVASSLNPSTFSATVTFTATVNGSSPTGTVTFKDGATVIGTSALSGTGNSRTATFAVSTLSVASHSITVVYSGDANNGVSTSSALSQVVNKGATSTVVSSNLNPSMINQTVTFTATVSSAGSATGSVTFKDSYTTLGSATLSGNVATFSTAALTYGTRNIIAVYAGDANNNTSTSAGYSQVVNLYATSTGFGSSANPSLATQTVTFTATVSGSGTPTGVITFKDGTTVLGTSTLSSGVAAFSTASLAAGTHSMTAAYGGNATNVASTSAALSQVVNKNTTTATLASSVNPSSGGQGVLLSFALSGGSVNASGNVTFKDGATALAIVPINAGAASFNISTLAAGSHSLSAVYAGDANNLASTSNTVSQTVNKAASTLTLIAPASASEGENVTLVARATGFNPSGVITFTDGGATLGTATLGGGAASLSISTLAVGSHSLAASYPGDASNVGSSASAVTLNVVVRAGMVWQYGYDAMGRINTIVDPNGLASYFYYDSLGRRIQSQQPPNTGASTPTVIEYAYNLADGLTSVTDPRSLATSYSPNGLGNVTTQTSPDSGGTQYSFDAKGNVLSRTDARGKVTSYSYDALDRLTAMSYPTGTATAFEYDGGTNPTPAAAGELTKMTDESGQTSYSYDALGRMTGKTVVIGSQPFTVGYSWGDSGGALDKLIAITYPSGSRVNYGYDAQGAINSISVNPVNANGVGSSGTAQPLLGSITYNAENKVGGWLWSDGKSRLIGYDSYGNVASYSLGDPLGTGNAAGALRTVQRDAAARITGYTHTNNGAAVTNLDQSFSYDNLNRLTGVTQAASTIQYTYDATGNRTAKVIGGTSYANTVSATSNRYTQVQDVGGTASISHDAAGNLVGDGSFTYSYSDRGRLASVTTAGGVVNYLYNGYGQRVQKIGPTAVVPAGTNYYLYDEVGQLLGEYDATGNPVYETIYLGGLPVGALKQSGSAATGDIAVSLYNVHADHIATPRLITRQDETIVWRWDSAEAFGAAAPDQDPSGLGTFVYNQRFPGQVFDAETGLLQNWNREYQSRWGRYVQSDSIGLGGGINTFSYVEGNPLRNADPLGLWSVEIGGGRFGIYSNFRFGYDDATDRWFFNMQFGRGVGGGLIYSPDGGLPSGVPDLVDCGGDQVFVGAFGKISGTVGAANMDFIEGAAGVATKTSRAYTGGTVFGPLSWGRKFGLKTEAAAGIEFTAISLPRKPLQCECAK
jgi:RHS repeat-associated protein